jgi:hypothetical protein
MRREPLLLDIARGLEHLHCTSHPDHHTASNRVTGHPQQIVHGDLKGVRPLPYLLPSFTKPP